MLALMMALAVADSPGAISEAAPPLSTITQPGWIKSPDSNQLGAVYPLEAARRGIGGRAVIRCLVNAHGLMEQCSVLEETPAGAGFGAAALLLAPTFQMRPMLQDGRPVRAATISIPIRFALPGPMANSVTGHKSLDDPPWVSAPAFADVARVYPAKADGAAGHVVLRCKVRPAGDLTHCETVAEDPRGVGFDQAARALLPLFRLQIDPSAFRGRAKIVVTVPFRILDPSSSEARRRHIEEPTWAVFVNPVSAEKLYPLQAVAKGVFTGHGVADCTVASDGSLQGCRPAPGDADGMGFSGATAIIASGMKMNLWTQAGGPVDGAQVRIPMRLDYSNPPPPQAKIP